MKRRLVRVLLVTITVCIVLGIAAIAIWTNRSFAAAEDLAKHGLWRHTRDQLRRYLWIYPSDERALLLMAESLVKDESLPARESAVEALTFLRRIQDRSSYSARARLQEGRVQFLLLHRPVAGERALRRALELDPQSLETCLMLIKLLEMTDRFSETETLFWKAYDLSSDDDRPTRLIEWYEGQYSSVTVNEPLDHRMGFIAPYETSTRETESRRYISFRENEKGEVLGHAALAAWLQREGQPLMALQILDKTPEHVPNAMQNPFYVSTLVATLVDLGQMRRAEQVFQAWPTPKEGFDYWKWKAIIDEEVRENPETALASYTRALDTWPGPTDWRLRYRKVNCLLQMGRTNEATTERKKAEAIEALMEDAVHSRLRDAMASPNDSNRVAEVIDFYRKLERDREADCWDRHRQRLASRSDRGELVAPNRSP